MSVRKILELDKNEQIIKEIKRHDLGLFVILGLGALSIFTLLVLMYFAVSAEDFIFETSALGYGLIFGSIISLVMLFTYIGAHVYKANELIITNENIIQVLQFTLLNRQVSQLNLAKIQDVSVDQIGLLSVILNYGTIEIETAGEASNFRFIYAHDPNTIAKIIIEAHEDYVRNHPAGHNTYRI